MAGPTFVVRRLKCGSGQRVTPLHKIIYNHLFCKTILPFIGTKYSLLLLILICIFLFILQCSKGKFPILQEFPPVLSRLFGVPSSTVTKLGQEALTNNRYVLKSAKCNLNGLYRDVLEGHKSSGKRFPSTFVHFRLKLGV